MITKEYRCAAHGEFESDGPTCPAGCPPVFVKQEFRTPVKIGTMKTRFVDQQLRGLQKDFNLPDIKNDKDGSSVMESIRKGENFAPQFVDIPHSPAGWSGRKEKPMAASPAPFLYGNKGEDNLTTRKDVLPPLRPRFVNPPNPAPDAFK